MISKYSAYIVQNVLLAVMYFIAAKIGLMLAFEQVNTSPVWPPTGIAIAALLCFGLRLWPGVFAGALAINWYVSSSAPLAITIGLGNTLEAVAAGYLIKRYANTWPFAKTKETALFIGIVALATMISASIGVGSLYISGAINTGALGLLWQTWWLGNLVGGLVFIPFLLTWRRLPKESYSNFQLLELGGLLLASFALIYLVFFDSPPSQSIHPNHYLLVFAFLPVLARSALRFRQHGATLQILVVSVGAIIGTVNGYGPFVLATPNDSLLLLQTTLGSVMLSVLLLMATQEERLQAITALQSIQDNLASMVTRRTIELKGKHEELKIQMQEQGQLTDAIQQLLRIIDRSEKEAFFLRCVEGLSLTFQTRFAFIGTFADEGKKSIATIAVWNGDKPGANFVYELKGTPCEDVFKNSMNLVPEHVTEHYPKDKLLVDMNVESYFGAPIISPSGDVVGVMAVMDTKPMGLTNWLEPLLGLFSNRVGMEIQQREATKELELAASVFRESTEAVVICDAKANIIRVNPAFSAITGFSLDEVVGQKPHFWKSDPNGTGFHEELWQALNEEGVWQGEVNSIRKNREVYVSWQIIKSVTNKAGAVKQYICIINDITEKKRAQEEIFHLAHNDTITRLPNRLSFHQQLEIAMAQALSSVSRLAVMFIDLDNFKLINDTSGHPVGDELLRKVAFRIQETIGPDNLVARFGGDEFTVILPNVASIESVAEVAQNILDAIIVPYTLSTNEVTTSASIGIGIYPDNGNEVSTLLSCADNAMYRAKDSGRSAFQFYTDQMQIDAQEQVELERDLRKALKHGEFQLYFQPQLEFNGRDICGVEALIRWHHPDKGLVPPDKFIPIAEASGLIVPIGTWVINEACKQLQQWQTLGFNHLTMAINLSARQVFQKDLLPALKKTIKQYDLSASSLEFEITESVMMKNIEEAINTLHEIKSLGVQLSIDDFGTGYSSLSYLKRFPLNKLKIDKSFVQGLPDDGDDVAIVRATIAIAHSLKLTVIAEGVETSEQLAFLKSNECDEFQGYYFSKPFPAEEITQQLIANAAGDHQDPPPERRI